MLDICRLDDREADSSLVQEAENLRTKEAKDAAQAWRSDSLLRTNGSRTQNLMSKSSNRKCAMPGEREG
jgi:hypothetical protein